MIKPQFPRVQSKSLRRARSSSRMSSRAATDIGAMLTRAPTELNTTDKTRKVRHLLDNCKKSVVTFDIARILFTGFGIYIHIWTRPFRSSKMSMAYIEGQIIKWNSGSPRSIFNKRLRSMRTQRHSESQPLWQQFKYKQRKDISLLVNLGMIKDLRVVLYRLVYRIANIVPE